MSEIGAWQVLDAVPSGFDAVLGEFQVRRIPGGAEARVHPGAKGMNVLGGLHGGFLAAVAEQCMFLPLYLNGKVGRGGAVTVAFNLQYIGPGLAEGPLEIRVELLKETGRMGFVRGDISQNDTVFLAFSGTLRKLSSGAQS
jgi:acyl-coenzyme A thioesterase PaaI-like protein